MFRGFRFFVLCFVKQIRHFLLWKQRDARLLSVVSVPLCFCMVKGRDVRLWRRSGVLYNLRTFVLYFVRPRCLRTAGLVSKGRDIYIWHPFGVPPGFRTSGVYFAWKARDLLLCKGRDVRVWCSSGVPG